MANREDGRHEPIIRATGDQPPLPHVVSMYQEIEVVLTDIDIPFGRLVLIMVKWIIAAIPAAILAAIIVYGTIFLLGLLGWIVIGPESLS